MENHIEKGPEHIPTKNEVLEVISRLAKETVVVRELYDNLGLSVLETKMADEAPGKFTQFEYIRKNQRPGAGGSSASVIYVVYYQDGEARPGSANVAEYDYDAGEWQEIK